jgi:predicted membrane protein
MRRSLASRIVTGLFIIAVGVLILGHVAFGWDIGNLAHSWWTLFIIVPGIAGILSSGFRFWNVFLVLIGVWLLSEDQNWLGRNAWPYFLGAALVIFGIYVITGGHGHPHDWSSKGGNFNQDTNDYPEYTSVFTTVRYANKSQNFRGGKASSVFGSMTVDLRDIGITGNTYFEVAGVFGGLEILAPKNVPLKVNITPVFGSFFNDAGYAAPSGGQPFMEIKGAAVFGSIKIL